jgi:cytosine/adenosine deaminase-related metal-dependent hydrolase
MELGETLDLIRGTDGTGRVLVQGATILSMDPAVGDLEHGDILIDGATIAAVGADLSSAAADGQAVVVDATDQIAIPGLVDAHRHCWQSQFRRLTPDFDLQDYIALMHLRLAPSYTPHDMYVGNLLAAAAAIDAGVTSVLDFSHNSRSGDHTDEAVRAWQDSGVRAVFGCCVSALPQEGYDWRGDLRRLRDGALHADDGRVTLRLAACAHAVPEVVGDLCISADSIGFARELGIGTTVDMVLGPGAAKQILELSADGALGPDVTWIHGTGLSDDAWRALADSGGRIVLATTSDAMVRQVDGVAPIQAVLDHGQRPALSVDVECCVTSDLFTQMQATLALQRMSSAQAMLRGEEAPPPLPARSVLEFATLGGAEANGLGDRCGSLTPGKRADLVLIDANAVSNLPLNNAVATVVLGATNANVRTVFVDGVPRKWDGRLLDADVRELRRLATESRDRLLDTIGYELDVLGQPARSAL